MMMLARMKKKEEKKNLCKWKNYKQRIQICKTIISCGEKKEENFLPFSPDNARQASPRN